MISAVKIIALIMFAPDCRIRINVDEIDVFHANDVIS